MTCTPESFKARRGFSLIEMLVVIAIVVLVASMLYPALTNALRISREKETQVYVTEVSQAINQYYGEEGHYPGQDNTSLLGSYSNSTPTFTGSQLLAACLFKYTDPDPATYAQNVVNPTSKIESDGYLDYKPEKLGSYPTVNAPNSLMDGADDPRPLLYFPARRGESAVNQCYIWADNSSYIIASGDDKTIEGIGTDVAESIFFGRNPDDGDTPQTGSDKAKGWNEKLGDYYAKDVRMSSASNDIARNQGQFLLFGAGYDGKYFTKDDPKSWKE